MKKRSYYGYLIVLIISTVVLLAGCNSLANSMYSSNGQRIYLTATSSSGEAITPEGFTMMMHRIACVDCHSFV